MKIRGRASYAGTCRASSKTFRMLYKSRDPKSQKNSKFLFSPPFFHSNSSFLSFSIGTSRTLRDRPSIFFSRVDSSAFLLEKADIVRATSSTSSICSRRANPRFLLLLHYVRGKFENLKATATFLGLCRAENEILRSNVRDAGIHHLPRGRWRRN